MRSIRSKLSLANMAVTIPIVLVLGGIFLAQTQSLTGQFLKSSIEQSADASSRMKESSAANERNLERVFRENMESKANALIAKDAIALRQPFLDNSIFFMREFISRSFQSDPDILMATFFVVDSDGIKAWEWVSRDATQGMGLGTEYRKDSRSWIGRDRGRRVVVPDPAMVEVLRSDRPEIHRSTWIVRDGASKREIEVYDVHAPVFDGQVADLHRLRRERAAIGYVRYIFSTERLQALIAEEEGKARQALVDYSRNHALQLEQQRGMVERARLSSFAIGLVAVLLLSFLSWFFIRTVSRRLTRPILELTDAAKDIAAGQYDREVVAPTNDEIGQLAETFERMRLRVRDFTQNLQRLVDERTRDLAKSYEELKAVQQKLVDTARQAGMAEVATGVLHNVGNLLNSVKTSNAEIGRHLKESKVGGLVKGTTMLRANRGDWPRFFSEDPKGLKLPEYLIGVGEALETEYAEMKNEQERLRSGIEMICDVVQAQQEFARNEQVLQEMPMGDLVEAALQVHAPSIARRSIQVVREFSPLPTMKLDKSRLLNVLVNLVKNAIEAMDSKPESERRLVISTGDRGDSAWVRVTDSGVGIEREHHQKIFQHGFTTKPKGHGFGLHASANAMTEIGGRIEVESPGVGLGASFTMVFPMERRKDKAA